MKKLLLAALLLGMSAMAHSSLNYNHNAQDRYNDVRPSHHMHQKRKQHFVKVVRSKPIYKEVITYRECRPHHKKYRRDGHQGAIIGGVVGGMIGNRVASKHRVQHTIGGAVTGAIIGATLNKHRQRPVKYCEHVERRLVGYKNIAYWHGKKIVRISDRPLRKIRIDRKHHGRGYARRY